MTAKHTIHLGYEIGTGKPVAVPLLNLAVTGQTQESGKTTTLEALAVRSAAKVITFVTKRGEGSFADGRRIRPYFRDRADWQFVDAILEAALGEKNKFLRQFLIPICRRTKTLADVQAAVRSGLKKAHGQKEGALIQLDAYLDLIVPDIARARLAPSIDLQPGLNVMDVSDFSTPMQMLFVQSALDWVNERERNTVVVIPEAWEFVPEGKGSPVKSSAITLVRKGSGIGNHIWVDSQDMAGVDKTILRGCPVWLIGVQREINEIKRNIANIPPPTGKPKAADVAMLERGQFFACFGRTLIKVYVQPAWMKESDAIDIASGVESIRAFRAIQPVNPKPQEDEVNEAEAAALRRRNAELEEHVAKLSAQVRDLNARLDGRGSDQARYERPAPTMAADTATVASIDAIYAEIKRRILADADTVVAIAKITISRPEIEVHVEKKMIEIDGTSPKGRIARLLAQGFYDGGKTNSMTRGELKRTGSDVNNANIDRILTELLRDGFLTLQGNEYHAVPAMKVRIIES